MLASLASLSVLGMSFGQIQLSPGGCISWAVAALIAGWLAGLLTRGRGFGCLGDIVLGLIGAFVGLLILDLINAPISGQQGFFGTILVSFIGSFLLALIGRLIGGPARQRGRRYREWTR
jgi:uncharacterized membrane protein YeaQ/YmgE (transglycosylase-associated protein family)